MKKSLIALALVAGFAQANETTLYGHIIGEFQVEKKPGGKTFADIGNNSRARFGIKGNEDLNAGLKAIYQMEFNYTFGQSTNGLRSNGALGEVRQAYVGLKGDFGTLKLGKQTTVHALFTNKADFSNSYGAGKDPFSTTRAAKAISYTSPDFGGVTVAGALIVDGSDTELTKFGSTSRGLKAFEVGAQYAANGLEAALTYGRADAAAGVKDTDYYSASVAYGADNFGVAFDFESGSHKNNYFALGGKYQFNEQGKVYGGVDMVDPKVGNREYSAYLGYQHNLSKRTFTWVELGSQRANLKDFTKTKGGYSATVGLRHDF